jgi:hypothetical protein
MTLVGITNAGGSPPAVGIATLQVSDGYFSASGTTASMANAAGAIIGVLKKGIVLVSAQDTASAANYVGQMSIVTLNGGSYVLNAMSSNVANASLGGANGNIVLVNSGGDGRTYNYSITYFPLP